MHPWTDKQLAAFCLEWCDLRRSVMAMTKDAAGEPASPAAGGQVSQARKLGRRLTRWWSKDQDGRTYRRRQADALAAAAGLGVVVVCGVLGAHRPHDRRRATARRGRRHVAAPA
jgi:hypothetical protein